MCCTSHRFEPSLCSEQSELIPGPILIISPEILEEGILDLGSVSVDTPAAYARGFVYCKSSLVKQQASSLTAGPGYDRMDLESEKI